jgi:hypothetical protein
MGSFFFRMLGSIPPDSSCADYSARFQIDQALPEPVDGVGLMLFVPVGLFAVRYKLSRAEDPLGSRDHARSLFNSFHL